MSITLITGPANAGKAELVMEALRGHLARGEEPLLIVPTRADVEHYLRELAGERAAIGLRVERFAGLIAEMVLRAGIVQPAIGALARERLLESLAAAEDPSRSRGARRGLARALSELLVELQVKRVSPQRLSRALQDWRAADGSDAAPLALDRLFDGYRAALRRLDRADGEERAVRALDALRERPALWGRTPVLLYGFDDLTALQLDAVETLGRIADAPVTVSLPYEPGRAAFGGRATTFQQLAPLVAEHRALQSRGEHYAPHARRALSHLERSLFEPGAARIDAGPALRLLEGGGERAELELVAREIEELLSRGLAAEEIAVLARPAGTSFELLGEVFAALGVPYTLQRRRPFGDAAVGRALLGLLRCVPSADAPAAGELGDLLAWLRAPGLLEQPGLADSLELRARRSGAQSAAEARALWEQRHWPLEAIDRLREAQERGPSALLERAARELYWLFCAPRRGAAAVLGAEQLDEAGALAAARRALGELRELARIARAGAPESAPESARPADRLPRALVPSTAAELAEVLQRLDFLSGEGPAPGAVAVLDPLALRARRVRALFVCGLQEGVFPARPRPQPLLAEEQRRRLAEVSGLRLSDQDEGTQEGQLAAERYLLYAAVSRPQEQLVLSWHSADDDGRSTPRSLFVDDVCDLFDADLLADRARRPLGAVDLQTEPVTVLSGSARSTQPLRDEQLLAELAARPWSASSLERRIACPVAWFVERVLRPDEFEPEPEPLARGALAHAALKDTLEELRRQTGSARLTPTTLARARELLDRALVANEAAHPLSVSPERRLAVRRRLQVDLQRYLEQAAASDSPLEPTELELGFGFDGQDDRGEATALPAFELGGGFRLRGRIDRIDVAPGGEAVVYDYKGKDAPAAARWIKEGKLQVALYMRAAEELLGLEVVGGLYQPLAGSDLRPRGVLDGDSGLELDCASTDVRERAEVRELLAEALAAARAAAEQTARGELQPLPQTCAWRGGCRYPTICRCER
ncbi:MAG TPA: PD-(D/E)XK nuclease family protein [Solirubrobacteraceae bacterium]|jgi:ATP-dependent helicase/DNAse subunit B|nr:PD-(D/E)XK nuclease family protein [Solirubrobacteraceae bacterium]